MARRAAAAEEELIHSCLLRVERKLGQAHQAEDIVEATRLFSEKEAFEKRVTDLQNSQAVLVGLIKGLRRAERMDATANVVKDVNEQMRRYEEQMPLTVINQSVESFRLHCDHMDAVEEALSNIYKNSQETIEKKFEIQKKAVDDKINKEVQQIDELPKPPIGFTRLQKFNQRIRSFVDRL